MISRRSILARRRGARRGRAHRLGAQAQAVDMLRLFVPAAPGGGWDQTARTIEAVLRATGAVNGVQVTNVPGAGGASACRSSSTTGAARAIR